MTDLLTSDFIVELRARHQRIEAALAEIDTLSPLAASGEVSPHPNPAESGVAGPYFTEITK